MRRVILVLMGFASVIALAAVGSRPCRLVHSSDVPVHATAEAIDHSAPIQSPAPDAAPSPAGHFLVCNPRTRTMSIAAGRLSCFSRTGTAEHSDPARRNSPRALCLTGAAPGTLLSSHIRLQI